MADPISLTVAGAVAVGSLISYLTTKKRIDQVAEANAQSIADLAKVVNVQTANFGKLSDHCKAAAEAQKASIARIEALENGQSRLEVGLDTMAVASEKALKSLNSALGAIQQSHHAAMEKLSKDAEASSKRLEEALAKQMEELAKMVSAPATLPLPTGLDLTDGAKKELAAAGMTVDDLPDRPGSGKGGRWTATDIHVWRAESRKAAAAATA